MRVAGMLIVTLMWSIAGVVTRQLDAARSFEVTFWRSLFTALALGGCCCRRCTAGARCRSAARAAAGRCGSRA